MRHLLSIGDLTRDDVERILETAGALQGVDEKLPALQGKLPPGVHIVPLSAVIRRPLVL